MSNFRHGTMTRIFARHGHGELISGDSIAEAATARVIDEWVASLVVGTAFSPDVGQLEREVIEWIAEHMGAYIAWVRRHRETVRAIVNGVLEGTAHRTQRSQ
jgi:hypothetical protein